MAIQNAPLYCMKYFSRYLSIVYFFLIICGAGLAFTLRNVTEISRLPNLISILGLGLDFIGVVLISDQFLKINEKYKGVQELVLASVLGLPFMLTIGGVVYAVLAFPFGIEFSDLWIKALGYVTLYIGCSLYGIDSITDGFKLNFLRSVKSRSNYYGWFILLSGLVLQIYSSVLELFG